MEKTLAPTIRRFPSKVNVNILPYTGTGPLECPAVPPGTVLLALGAPAHKALEALKLYPKNRATSTVAAKPVRHPDGGWVLISYDPFMVRVDPSLSWEITWALNLAHRLATTDNPLPKLGQYSYVQTLQPVIDYVKACYKATGKPVPVDCDLETMGLVPYKDDVRILTISFTALAGYSDVYRVPPDGIPDSEVLAQIDWLLNSEMISLSGANFKFDLGWIREKWGLLCSNFRFDNCLGGSLLDENISNSLKVHAKIRTPLGGYSDAFDDKYDKGAMELIPPEEVLPYAGADTDAGLQAANIHRRQILADGELARFYTTILHRASRAFERIEARGLHVDLQEYENVRVELEGGTYVKGPEKGKKTKGVIAECDEKMLAILPAKLKQKYADDLSLSRPVVIKDFFFSPLGLNLKPKMRTANNNQPSTAKAHLNMFKDDERAAPFIKLMQARGQATKMLSTYVKGFLSHIRNDGKFHPTYILFHGDVFDNDDESGTVSGRLACTGPAMQTLPKHKRGDIDWAKKLRKCFPAPPGYKVLLKDYEQGELKVCACIAHEPAMIEAYKQGLDLHALTGATLNDYEFDELVTLMGYPKGTPERELADRIRQGGKVGNFGLIYGMQAEGLVAYAWQVYGVILTVEQAEAFRAKFFARYTRLEPWHNETKQVIYREKQVRSPFGRIRHLPHIDSEDRYQQSRARLQGVNFAVQATLTDMMIWAMALIEEQYGDDLALNDGLQQVGMTHDQAMFYAPEDDVLGWDKRLADVIENLPFKEFDWYPELQFTCDGEYGSTLGDVEKIKKAA